MVLPLRLNFTHEGHHREVTASVSPLSSHSIQKLSVAKMSKIGIFTDMRAPLFIAVSKVTQVLGGLRMVAKAFRSGRDIEGG